MSSSDGLFVSARSRAEYEGMFDLSFSRSAHKRILDCGAGGASFVAEWVQAGGKARACDSLYSEPLTAQAAAVLSGVERAAQNITDEPHLYVWDVFESPARHRAARQRAAEVFLADIGAHRERYVAASLPTLPFEDGGFDLVLSSHLLFAYSRSLTLDDHLAYMREMMRVASEEVRIYPLIGFEGDASGLVDAVVSDATARGFRCSRRRAAYHFLRGATEYLRISK